MIVTVELSLYPLDQEYEKHIIQFIKNLNKHPEITVLTNAMSTYLQGEFDQVMKILTAELSTIYDKIKVSSTVIKVVNAELDIKDGFKTF